MNKLFILLILTFNIGYLHASKKSVYASFDNLEKAKNYNDQGVKKIQLDDQKGALANLKKAIKLNPKLPEAYYNLGEVYTALGEHEKAILNYTKAIKLDSRLSKGNKFWMQALLNTTTITINHNFFRGISPHFFKAHNNLGKAKMKLGYYKEAIKNFTEVINRGSQSDIAEAYYNRGVASLIKNSIKNTLAVKDIKKAIELGYQTASAYKYLGFSLTAVASTKKEFRTAIEFLDIAIELGLKPVEAAEVYSFRALARSFTVPLMYIKKIEQPLVKVEYDMNTVMQKKVAHNKRINGNRRLFATSAENTAEYNQSTMDTLFKRSEKLQILADYTKSLELDPTSAKNYNRRGKMNFELDNNPEAIEDFKKVIEMNPDFIVIEEARHNLKIVHYRLGSIDRKCSDLF